MNKIFEDTLFAQRLLSSCGLYQGVLDGRYGGMTKAAEDAFEASFNEIKKQLGEFDLRSEGNIASLIPKAQIMARKVLNAAKVMPFQVKILSGTRTYEEQNLLYAKRPKVTNAKGGQSNHNFGIAIDVGIFVAGDYYEGNNAKEEKAYVDLSKVIKYSVSNIDWGGDWRSFRDAPHYELHTGKSVSQCRALLEAGKPYV